VKLREELKKQYDALLKREREIIDHINNNSPDLTKEEIQGLDKERVKCVADRSGVRKKMSVLDNVVNMLSKKDKSALEILRELLDGIKVNETQATE
jgi:hypothetical protein